MFVWFFFFFKQKTAYEIGVRLVGSEMCIRDRIPPGFPPPPHPACLWPPEPSAPRIHWPGGGRPPRLHLFATLPGCKPPATHPRTKRILSCPRQAASAWSVSAPRDHHPSAAQPSTPLRSQ